MPRLDSSKAEVLVFTFKEGLLSAVAHDLKLQLTRFTIEHEGERSVAEFEAGSIRVVTAMKEGRDDPSTLSASAKADIEKNTLSDVLDVRKHPTARFESVRMTDTQLEGRLTLHGVTKTLTGALHTSGGVTTAEFRFDQRDFGIKPFSAMLGTLKIKPEVVVRVSLRE
ncbi:MAG: YceI family protein [Archangium sp.]|nr:YceI family protein [Archangium sp.]